MLKALVSEEDVIARLCACPDGERRATNLLHVSELLHQASVEKGLGMAGLIKWLSEKRTAGVETREEHQLRLESDENAVKIVTIHKSKGLEYPVVFCPFNWGPSRAAGDVFSFHDETDSWRLNVALEPLGEEARRAAEREQLAENVRLLYVSVTRAKNRCYLVWGLINRAETSSLAYVLHPPEGDLESAVDDTAARFTGMDENSLRRELEEIAAASDGAVDFALLPEGPQPPIAPRDGQIGPLAARAVRRHVGRAFEVASFSSLVEEADRGVAAGEGLTELPDHDERASGRLAVQPADPSSLFAFPGPRGQGSASTPFSNASTLPAPIGTPSGKSWALRLRSTATNRTGATPCAT